MTATFVVTVADVSWFQAELASGLFSGRVLAFNAVKRGTEEYALRGDSMKRRTERARADRASLDVDGWARAIHGGTA